MKNNITKTIAVLIASAGSLMAHPGAPGHKHSGTEEEWPFPDFSWPSVIVSLGLIAFVFYVYKELKKGSSERK